MAVIAVQRKAWLQTSVVMSAALSWGRTICIRLTDTARKYSARLALQPVVVGYRV
jgi:hypothetical protein